MDPRFERAKEIEDPNGISGIKAFCLPSKDQEQDDGTNRRRLKSPLEYPRAIPFFHIHVIAWHVFIFA